MESIQRGALNPGTVDGNVVNAIPDCLPISPALKGPFEKNGTRSSVTREYPRDAGQDLRRRWRRALFGNIPTVQVTRAVMPHALGALQVADDFVFRGCGYPGGVAFGRRWGGRAAGDGPAECRRGYRLRDAGPIDRRRDAIPTFVTFPSATNVHDPSRPSVEMVAENLRFRAEFSRTTSRAPRAPIDPGGRRRRTTSPECL